MKKWVQQRILGGFILCLCLAAAILAPLTEGNAEQPTHTVVIDAGHGGEDGGAIGKNGAYEKEQGPRYITYRGV